MPQNPQDVTNPGTINVADEAFGLGLPVPNQPISTGPATNPGPLADAVGFAPGAGIDYPDQAVRVGPSTNPGPVEQGGDLAPGLGVDSPDQPVTVGPSQNAGSFVDGGAGSQVSSTVINTTQNTVVDQTYGNGTTVNVYV